LLGDACEHAGHDFVAVVEVPKCIDARHLCWSRSGRLMLAALDATEAPTDMDVAGLRRNDLASGQSL